MRKFLKENFDDFKFFIVFRNFCIPQNNFWCKFRYKTLMGRRPNFFYHILKAIFIFFLKVHTNLFSNFGLRNPLKNPKEPKKSIRYLFLHFVFGTHIWIVIVYKHLFCTPQKFKKSYHVRRFLSTN